MGSKAQSQSTKKNLSSSDIAKRNLIKTWKAECKKIIAGKHPGRGESFVRMPGENYRDSEGPVFGSWLEICYLSGELEAEARSGDVEAAKLKYSKNWTGLWTVEWSEEQGFFHTQEADTRLLENIHNFLTKRQNQYNIIGIFNTYNEAKEFIQSSVVCSAVVQALLQSSRQALAFEL